MEVRSVMSGDGLDASASALFSTAADDAFPMYESEEQLRDELLAFAIKQYEHLFGTRQEGWDFGRVYLAGTTNDSSSTNVQVGGIDEADLVENDGRYLFQVSGQKLVIVDTQSAAGLKVAAQVDLPVGSSSIYLSGDLLTVVTRRWGSYFAYDLPNISINIALPGVDPAPVDFMSGPASIVSVFDVSDRANPVLDHQIHIEGGLNDSRRIDDRLYLVSSQSLQLPRPLLKPDAPSTTIELKPPVGGINVFNNSLAIDTSVLLPAYSPWYPGWPNGSGTFETKDEYLARVAPLIVDAVLPHFRATNSDGTLGPRGLLAAATDVYRREIGDNTSLVSVNVLNLASVGDQRPTSVVVPMAHPNQVYMSHQNLYLASNTWDAAGRQIRTEITQFALRGDGSSVALTSIGAVDGRLIDQFSMDEFDGYLRVATQVGWDRLAFSNVFVLERDGQALNIVGRLENLAPGERMFSSRFDGPRGFVVTFGPEWQPNRPERPANWVDPLFSIDLSDPTNPQLRGRLEIPGLSNYLHFVDGNHLIGFGRDADISTGQQLAPQLSLFDVTDMANPRLLSRLTIPTQLHGWSSAFSDHHAISYYPEDGILAIPFASQLALFKVDLTSSTPLVELGSIDLVSTAQRSARIDDRLYSITESYIQANDLTDLKKIGLVYYGDLAFYQHFVVDKTNVDRTLNVLDMRQLPDEVRERLRLVAVSEGSGGGTLKIADDGRSILYTPPADFSVRSESFIFTVQDEDGRTQTAQGHVNIAWDSYRGPMREKAIAELAELLDVSTTEIHEMWWSYNGSSNSDRTWKDTCLEAGAPGESCVETPTPGFAFELIYASSKFIYRTDLTDKVRFVRDDLNVGDDEFTVEENSSDNGFDVLLNDYLGVRHYASPKIVAVTASTHGSTISISEDGQRLIYTPAAGFAGVERFTYTLAGGEEASVKVKVPWDRFRDQMVQHSRQELAGLTGASLDDITLVQSVERVWPDSALGLRPLDGEERIQRWTAGFEIDLRYQGALVVYYTDTSSKARIAYSSELTVPDKFDVVQDSAATELLVLGNDFPGAIRPELTIGAISQGAAGGKVEVSPGGRSILYTPAAGFLGTDRFTYSVNGIDATVEVTIKTAGEMAASMAQWHNLQSPADINNDGLVTPLDALILINQINRAGGNSFMRVAQAAVGAAITSLYCDPNGDGYLTPADVLHVVNALRTPAAAPPAANTSPSESVPPASAAPVGATAPEGTTPGTPSLRIRLASSRDEAGSSSSTALQGQAMTASVAAEANKFDSLPVSENDSRSDELFDAIARDLVGAAS